MSKVIKYIFLNLFTCLSVVGSAQIKSAIVGVDGLTCSACSFATEKSILKLEFVDSVRMELEKKIAYVYFKKESKVSITELAQKVVDAGFAVRSIFILAELNQKKVSNDFCLTIGEDVFQFVKISSESELNGLVTLKIVGDKFMSKKEFKNWRMYCSAKCNSTATISSKIYYATLP